MNAFREKVNSNQQLMLMKEMIFASPSVKNWGPIFLKVLGKTEYYLRNLGPICEQAFLKKCHIMYVWKNAHLRVPTQNQF